MTFPDSPRVVYRQNPLEEVICQLQFPTILEISAERPARFQSRIRDAYPLYEVDQPKLPKEIAEVIARLPIAKPAEDITYKFLAADRDRFISLAPQFVAFTDTAYVRWERFSKEVQRAQGALEEIYRPAFYTRIGLRYRDVIDRQKLGIPNESWERLLKPTILGLLGAQDGVGSHVREILSQVSISLDEVPGSTATVRHGLATSDEDNRTAYVIDVDFFTTERTNSNDVSAILRRFNQLGGNFFRWAITDRLRDILGPSELEDES